MQLRQHIFRNHLVIGGMRAVWCAGNDRRASIGCAADGHFQRDFAKERCANPCGLGRCTAMPEYIMPAAAVRADKMAHILDNPQNWHIHLVEHVQPLARVNQRQILRR